MQTGFKCVFSVLLLFTAGRLASASGLETARWQAAIDAVAANGGGRVVIPAGVHPVGQLELRNNVELHLERGAVLEGAAGMENYRSVALPYSEGDWSAVVAGFGVTNVAITGEGEINGRGERFTMDFRLAPKDVNPAGLRPRGVFFSDSSGIRLEDFTLRDAACWGIVFKRCEKVIARRVKVDNHAHDNNDGFDIEAKDVLIEDCDIDSGDDSICVKSNDPGYCVENVLVRRCVVRSHSNGLKLGTASHGTMRNIRFENCRAEAPRRDFRSRVPGKEGKWFYSENRTAHLPAGMGISAICVECVDGGVVENVSYDGIEISGFRVPIFVRGGTRWKRGYCDVPLGDRRILRNVSIRNICGRAESAIPSSITGVDGCVPKDVLLENVSLVCCGDPKDLRPIEIPDQKYAGLYPEATMFRDIRLPACGLFVDRAERVKLVNTTFTLEAGTGDGRRKVVFTEGVSRGMVSPLTWPDVTQTMKPWAINWWLGGAADEAGLENQCAEMERAHFGGFNVVHAYVSFYNSTHRKETPHPSCIPAEECRDFMSEEWLDAWNSAVRIARNHGLGVDLSMCSGWCFGGPWVTKEDACSSLLPVHVSGPGGEGYHIDPFSPTAMSNHIARFETAFGKNGTAERPRAFYHDSFEYYGAKPKHGEDVDEAMLATFGVWTEWCRENGYETRYQAHGSPANWLDLYALGSIPETEMFGRRDRSRDILLSKFASSAAHVTGKRLVSAEACTWVEEHFRERPADVKLMLDQMFLAGINHMFFHGYSYSPVDADWPGRSFFASLQMNPRNPLWREVTTLNDYVIRCQSIFQTWQPDNDLLLRWAPDEFRASSPRNVGEMMTILDAETWFYPTSYGKRARGLWANGYQFDFVSDRQLAANPSLRARLDAANAKPSPFSPRANGLMSTRWRKDGRTLHFVANTLNEPRVLTGRFTVMDPMTGRIASYTRYVLHPLSSVFVEGGDVSVSGLETKMPDYPLVDLSWRVSPVVGGPVLPPATNLTALASWSTWDEAFSGTMRYETTFDRPVGCAACAPLDLDLGDVREAAHVWLNGMDLGCVLISPYRFRLPAALLKERGNALCVEVSSLGANRLRWICRTNQHWKRFAEENLCNYDYKPFDADKWDVLPCGLLGPVVLCERESAGATHNGAATVDRRGK